MWIGCCMRPRQQIFPQYWQHFVKFNGLWQHLPIVKCFPTSAAACMAFILYWCLLNIRHMKWMNYCYGLMGPDLPSTIVAISSWSLSHNTDAKIQVYSPPIFPAPRSNPLVKQQLRHHEFQISSGADLVTIFGCCENFNVAVWSCRFSRVHGCFLTMYAFVHVLSLWPSQLPLPALPNCMWAWLQSTMFNPIGTLH